MIHSFLFFFPLCEQFDDDALTLFGCHSGWEEGVQFPLREVDSSAILIGNGSIHSGCEGVLGDIINVLQFLQSLDRVLRLCVGTWEGAPLSFSANMLKGISRVINAYGDTVKDDLFKERLSRVSIKELTRTAKDRRAGSLGYAEAIVTFYNKRSRFGLSMEKLYSHKSKKNKGTGDNDEIPDASTDTLNEAQQLSLEDVAEQNNLSETIDTSGQV